MGLGLDILRGMYRRAWSEAGEGALPADSSPQDKGQEERFDMARRSEAACNEYQYLSRYLDNYDNLVTYARKTNQYPKRLC